jgi:hypothetical protein
MKKASIFGLIMFIMITVSGCNSYLGNEKVGKYDKKNSTELLDIGSTNYGPHDREHGLDQDEITDQNPNFLNLNTDNETHVNNIGFGIEKARDVIEANQNFNAGPIWRNGNKLHITVYPETNLQGKQKSEAKKQLKKELMTALPTYRIDLNIGNR